MHRSILCISILSGLFAAACSPADPFITATCKKVDQHRGAFLRVIAAPTAPSMMVFVDTVRMFATPQNYLHFVQENNSLEGQYNNARYYMVPAGTEKISFKAGDGTHVDTTVEMTSRSYYTAYLYGTNGSYHVLVTTDTPEDIPDQDLTRVRIVQLSPDAGTVRVALDFRSGTKVLADHLSYGQASDYTLDSSFLFTNAPAIHVDDANTGRQIYFIGPNSSFLPGGQVCTLLITGKAIPTVGDTTIYFAAMEERAKDEHCLYGQAPTPIKFAALRLINLIPTGTVDGPRDPMNRIDLSFLASAWIPKDKPEYLANDRYRRELTYGQKQVMEIFNLQTYTGGRHLNPHIFLSLAIFPTSYQMELHMPSPVPDGDQYRYQYQPRLVKGPQPLNLRGNGWYTIVAYGPLDTSGTVDGSRILVDDIPIVPGLASVRFFHGAYNTGSSKLQKRRLRLRVKGTSNQTESLLYGEAHSGGTGTIAVDPGPVRFVVVDESGTVVLEQEVVLSDADCGYIVCLHRGATGDTLRLDAAKQELTFQ